MIERIYHFIEKNNMIRQKDTVLVGVSGGADSVCLLYVLCALRERLGINILAVHVHHGIRGEEADMDASYVRSICSELGVECEMIYADIPNIARERHLTEEEAGRIVRYDSFNEFVKNGRAQKIAVAHNKNDNAETILFNMLRGSGVKGLGGIRPVRENIIRPLLDTGREEIEAFLDEKGIKYCIDSTNLSEEYTRNKIRRKLLRYAAENINAGAVDNIVEAGYRLSETEEYVFEEAKKAYEELAEDFGDGVDIDNEGFLKKPLLLRKYIIMIAFEAVCGRRKDITAKHIESTVELSGKEVGHSIDLPYRMTAIRTYGKLRICIKASSEDICENAMPKFTLRELEMKKELVIPQKMYTKWFDYDKIKGNLKIRFRQEGDYIELLSGGHKKSISRYMIDNKIPADIRDRIPLLVDDEGVIWIIGYRISERYKVSDSTKRILEVNILQ